MPPDYKLQEEEIAILTTWIADGAAWPSAGDPGPNSRRPADRYEQLKADSLDLAAADEARRPRRSGDGVAPRRH